MSEYIEIKRGNEKDYNEFMALINKTFGFRVKPSGFLSMLPKLYKKEYKPVSNNVILKVNNEMRAAIGLYYDTLIVGDENLKIGGIGNVAVHPDYRGMGYMKFGMAYCLDEMKQNMCDISVLGGRRQRYEYFSFEQGGIRYAFSFNKNNINYNFGKKFKSTYTVRKINKKNDLAICDIRKSYEKNASRYARDKMSYNDILYSWHSKPYVAYKDGEFKGYFVFNEKKNYVNEFACVNEESLPELVAKIVEMSPDNNVEFAIPQYDTVNCKFFEKYGEGVRIEYAEMFSVFNYEKVIRAFLKLKSTYTNLPDGETVILINGEKLPEKIKITVKDNNVTVEETDEKEDIYLEHLEAMKFFFGFYSDKRLTAKPQCNAYFPLPLFAGSQDAV